MGPIEWGSGKDQRTKNLDGKHWTYLGTCTNHLKELRYYFYRRQDVEISKKTDIDYDQTV